MYRSTISLHQSQIPQRQLRSGRDISRHGSCGTISALLQRPCQPYFLLLHCVEADVIFPNCGSLTQWRCASAARTGLVSTSMSPDHGTPGNGLLSFFRVDDFDLAPWRFKGHALSPVVSKRSHTTIRTLERRSFAPRSGRILRYDQSALGLKCEPSATPTAADHHMN